MKEFTSPVLYHQEWALPSNYSITPLLSHTVSYTSSSLSEMSFSLFKYDKLDQTYSKIPLPSDKTPPKATPIPTDYILIGRDLQQWKESSDPSDPTKHFEEVWSDALRCLPLASWKEVGMASLPLQAAAKKHNCFVPRHQFLMGTIGHGKFEVWLYNVSETRLRKLKVQLTSLLNWQTTRTGFLHQLLSQKMGLFHHTTGKDISSAVQLANKYCTTPQNIGIIVKQSRPPPEEMSPATITRQFSRSAPPTPQIELDSFYQDKQPLSPLPSKPTDPVTRHGIQFREMLSHQRETSKQKELLGKVFESWEQRGIDNSAPISTEVIAKLKRTSRLLHFCSSPLLFFPGTTTQSIKEGGGAKVGGASQDEQDSTWT
uniref:Uncharacterized protein n=1 Tax=Amphimedon queenslandica TaxID=400682 RepID=A0A1X7SWD4_AMPQE